MSEQDKRKLVWLLSAAALIVVAIVVLMIIGSQPAQSAEPEEMLADIAAVCGEPTSTSTAGDGNFVAYYTVDAEAYSRLTELFPEGKAEYAEYTAVITYDTDSGQLSATAIRKGE